MENEWMEILRKIYSWDLDNLCSELPGWFTSMSKATLYWQDVACDQQDLLEEERSALSSLEEEAATERSKIRELEDQVIIHKT